VLGNVIFPAQEPLCGQHLFFVLLPGDLISALIVEKLLWNSGLTVTQMAFIEIPLEVAVNLCVWLLCVKVIRVIKRAMQRRRRQTFAG
jgi:hypothetical protein